MNLEPAIFFSLSVMCLFGCSREISCSDEDTLDTLSSLISESFARSVKVSPSDAFIKEVVDNREYEFSAVRKIALDESTGATGCAAKYSIYFKNDDKKIGPMATQYSVTPTEDGNTYIELLRR